MKGITWKNVNDGKKPQWMGHVINDVVYARIAPKVLSSLREKNPIVLSKNNKAYRKTKNTQWIEDKYGHDKLKEHLNVVVVLARAAGFNWNTFKKLIDRSLPKFNEDGSISMELGFSDID